MDISLIKVYLILVNNCSIDLQSDDIESQMMDTCLIVLSVIECNTMNMYWSR